MDGIAVLIGFEMPFKNRGTIRTRIRFHLHRRSPETSTLSFPKYAWKS